MFSGNIAVIHSVLGELTDATNQALAFPIYGLCWPLGSIIGFVGYSRLYMIMTYIVVIRPLIGGSFSNPATKLPQWFNYELFKEYPYLLPCLMAASFSAVGALLGVFCLEEVSVESPEHYELD